MQGLRVPIAALVVLSSSAIGGKAPKPFEPTNLQGDFVTGMPGASAIVTRSDRQSGDTQEVSATEYSIARSDGRFLWVKQASEEYRTGTGRERSNANWLFSHDGLLRIDMLKKDKLADPAAIVAVRRAGDFPLEMGSSLQVVRKTAAGSSSYTLVSSGEVEGPPALRQFGPLLSIDYDDGRPAYLWSSKLRWPVQSFSGEDVAEQVTGTRTGKAVAGESFEQAKIAIGETPVGKAGRKMASERRSKMFGAVLAGLSGNPAAMAAVAGSQTATAGGATTDPLLAALLGQAGGTTGVTGLPGLGVVPGATGTTGKTKLLGAITRIAGAVAAAQVASANAAASEAEGSSFAGGSAAAGAGGVGGASTGGAAGAGSGTIGGSMYRPSKIARTAGQCPETLGHLAGTLPDYGDPELNMIRREILTGNIRQHYNSLIAQGHSPQALTTASVQQAIEGEKAIPQTEATIRAAAVSPDSVIANLRNGRLPGGDGIVGSAAKAWVAANYMVVASTETAVVIACLSRS